MPIRLFTCFTPNWCRKPNIIYILIFIDVKNIAVKTSICIRHTFSVPSMTGIVLHIFRVDHGNKSQQGSQQRPHSLFFRWTKVSRCSSNPLWNHLKSINQIRIFLSLWGWWSNNTYRINIWCKNCWKLGSIVKLLFSKHLPSYRNLYLILTNIKAQIMRLEKIGRSTLER